ncbi:hypothetical protein M514_08552 [Trichuris suis]|uniref:Uncharacterized protein n=1 Tax=Trichuris suis TaxID=68888 RepID=A0A085NE01_9BILA|nr:hypothetical protein M513_08552 [Trichuris suis]KFD67697.1 hypothetical protein M514_08552 [Trichuris suis]
MSSLVSLGPLFELSAKHVKRQLVPLGVACHLFYLSCPETGDTEESIRLKCPSEAVGHLSTFGYFYATVAEGK